MEVVDGILGSLRVVQVSHARTRLVHEYLDLEEEGGDYVT